MHDNRGHAKEPVLRHTYTACLLAELLTVYPHWVKDICSNRNQTALCDVQTEAHVDVFSVEDYN